MPEDKVEMVRSFYKYLESDDDDSDFEKSNLTDEEYCKNTSHLFVHNIRAVSRIMSNYAAKWVK